MDTSKVALGALLLAASGLTMAVTDQPGASVPLGLAGLSTLGVVASAVTGATGERRRHRQ